MDVDGDVGRRELGLRGQRRGTGSDEGTAANSLSGYSRSRIKKDSGFDLHIRRGPLNLGQVDGCQLHVGRREVLIETM
jgi:hypothetical protein